VKQIAESDPDTIGLNVAGRAALLLAGILSSFAQAGLYPILPAIESHFANYPAAGVLSRLLVSIIGAMIVVGAPFMGTLADRYGRRRLLLGSMIVYGIAGCAGFLIDNLYALFVSRLFVGLSTAAIGAIILAIVVTHSVGQARNRWLGYSNTVGVLSTVLLLPLAGAMGHRGWHWPFLLHAIAFPLLVLAYVGIEPDRPVGRTQTRATDRRSFKSLPWRLMLIAAAGGALLSTPSFYFPFHLRDVGLGDPRQISTAFVPNVLCAAGAAFFYGAVRTRLQLNATFVLAFGISSAGLILSGAAHTYSLIIIGMIVAGCSVGLIATNIYALAAATGRDSNRAQIMGLTKGSMFCGPLIAQLILEPIVKASSAGNAIIVLGAYAFLLMMMAAWRAGPAGAAEYRGSGSR
jgi:MFS family permease